MGFQRASGRKHNAVELLVEFVMEDVYNKPHYSFLLWTLVTVFRHILVRGLKARSQDAGINWHRTVALPTAAMRFD